MTTEALVAGLQKCLGEIAPSDAERNALGASLRSWADGPPELTASLSVLAGTIERGGARRELAVAAARAMRMLAQANAAASGRADAADKERKPPDRNRRRDEARAWRQSQAVQGDHADAPTAGRPVESLSGIGPRIGLAMRGRGLYTLSDLAWLLPLGYHDERSVVPISDLMVGQRQVAVGRVVSAQMSLRGRGRRIAEVLIEQADGADGDGARLRLCWFYVPQGLVARFSEGARFRVAGTIEQYQGMPCITHPQTERLAAAEVAKSAGIVPRYPTVAGVPPRLLARAVAEAVRRCAPQVPDAIPESLRTQHGMCSVGAALTALHTPPKDVDVEALEVWNEGRTTHHERLAFEEFFLLELALHYRRAEEQGVVAEPLQPAPEQVARAEQAIGFVLTGAQRRVVDEIGKDMQSTRPMRRLLQGDVGSGKTAVALLAAAHAISAGAQVAFMAPTEVLAEQHFRSLAPVAEAMGLRTALALGGERASHRRRTRKALEEGRVDLIVGTHALLSEGVRFARLRLVIVDEQHRFGVGQRLRLTDKAQGLAPHLLVMTATPIPRSLALAMHGDLSSSVLDEMPPGRKPPVTRAYRGTEREQALRQLERGLESGGQAYVVCPTIEPNEETGLRSVTETFEELSQRLGRFGVALLHGQLPAEEKQRAMERFGRGEVRVLVATTIVEVGLDVRSANVMVIEHAERFGLAQLHQLRGRVGRAGQLSACLLLHDASGEDSLARIRIMCESSDGFRIAEEDLRLRGPGELFGRKQSGLPGFRFGDLLRDTALLERAQSMAQSLILQDPELGRPEHEGARKALLALSESDRAIVKEEAG